jgi:glycosyltransferase involved in cell wall biosynthesis
MGADQAAPIGGSAVTDTPTPVDLTLVIACYNEEPILEASVAETLQVLDNLKRTFEIVFVDDASQDGTRGIIDEIIRTHPNHRLRKIEHAGNIGRGGTVTDGIRAAAAPVVGFIDIDLEVRAGYILPCLLAIDRGYDVATALRIYKFSVRSLNRYVMSRGYRWLMRKVLRVPLNDTETGFKFFRRDAVLPILDRTEDRGWFWDTEIMVRAHHAGLTIIEIPALFIRRFDKQSSLHPFADTLDYARKLWRFRQTARALGSQIR